MHCDNEGAVTITNMGKTRDQFLDLCLRHLSMLCAGFNIELQVKHIKRVENVVADALSQGKYDKLGDGI